MKPIREHAHVLFADVGGFSRLSDPHLLNYIEKFLPDLSKSLDIQDSEYVNTWGDGIVITSPTIRRLTQIALRMRDHFSNCDWETANIPQLDVRVSLHRGEFYRGEDPITKRGLIGGSTINLAARIEPITKAGMVWASEKFARDLIDDQNSASTKIAAADPLGLFQLPKGAGEISIFHIRRPRETQLSKEQITEIRIEAEARRLVPTSQKSDVPKQNYEVVVGVVEREGEVLLVKRHPNSEALDWMFPSGKWFKMQEQSHSVWKEVNDETGLNCRVVGKIAERESHPKTGVRCHYWHLRPLDDSEPKNGDPYENIDVRWVKTSEVNDFVGKELYEPIGNWLASLGKR